jgi:hypothetical protein
MISIVIDDASLAVGELLTGSVHWTCDHDRGAARAIEVLAQWESSGGDHVAYGVARSTRVRLSRDQRTADVPVRLLIPHEGPITFRGALLTITWKLHVRIDRLGPNEIAHRTFTVRARQLPSKGSDPVDGT